MADLSPRVTDAGPSIIAARLVLPAVTGRPGAAYFTLRNAAQPARTIVAVTVDTARKAEMHETDGGAMTPLASVAVPQNGEVRFAPGGRHVMLFGLPAALRPGGAARLTITFAAGRDVSAPMAVQAAGGADAMAGMQM